MTLQEARELLGIDAQASRDDARRAYLRRVKLYKPEKDPEGFRRLREAYERVDGASDPEALSFEQPIAVKPAPEAPEARDPKLDGRQAEWDTDEAELGWREPIGAEPPAPELYVMFDQARREIEAQRPQQGRMLILQVLEQARLAGRERGALFQMALEVFFRLQALSELGESNHVLAALESLMEDTLQDALAADGGALIGRLQLARELAAIPAEFPGDLRAAIARAVLANDLAQARDAMHELAMRDPRRASAAAKLLSNAPRLYDLYDYILSGSLSARTPRVSSSDLVPGCMAYFLLMALVSLFRGCEPDVSQRLSSPDQLEHFNSQQLYSRAAMTVQRICGGDPSAEKVPGFCLRAQSYVLDIKTGTCTSAVTTMRDLTQLVLASGEKGSSLVPLVRQLELGLDTQCPHLTLWEKEQPMR